MEGVTWEYRCFLPRTTGLTAAALVAASLSREAGPECRTDEYVAVDDEHGVKRRGGAPAGVQLELKTCVERRPNGAQKLAKAQVARGGDSWRDARGPLEATLAAAVDAGAASAGGVVRVAKQRWTGVAADRRVQWEVTKLKLANGAKWLTLCCEGPDAEEVAAAGAALLSAVASAARLPPYAPRVCSYAAWVCERAREQAAAPR